MALTAAAAAVGQREGWGAAPAYSSPVLATALVAACTPAAVGVPAALAPDQYYQLRELQVFQFVICQMIAKADLPGIGAGGRGVDPARRCLLLWLHACAHTPHGACNGIAACTVEIHRCAMGFCC